MRIVLGLVLCLLCACSSGPGAPGEEQVPPAQEPTADQAVDRPPATRPSTSTGAVSDAVPSLAELREIGITDQAAECFIATIDPNGTGRVASAELFMEALAACL